MKKRILIFIMAVVTLFSLTGCGASSASQEPVSGNVADELFSLTLTSESGLYDSETPIVCYAVLKYIGYEPLTVYHSDPLIGFGIKDDKYFSNEFFSCDVLLTTTFEPEDEIIVGFTKSGAWSEDDEYAEFYKTFYAQPELLLPKGDYTLSVFVNYSLDENDILGSMQSMIASVDVKVKK